MNSLHAKSTHKRGQAIAIDWKNLLKLSECEEDFESRQHAPFTELISALANKHAAGKCVTDWRYKMQQKGHSIAFKEELSDWDCLQETIARKVHI